MPDVTVRGGHVARGCDGGRSGGAKSQGTLEPLEAGRGDRQDTPLNPSLGEKRFLLFEATRFVTICYGSHRISALHPVRSSARKGNGTTGPNLSLHRAVLRPLGSESTWSRERATRLPGSVRGKWSPWRNT